MDSTLLEDRETCKNSFDVLSFEKKLVELVEELRLRRNLEAENEKNLKWLMDEKYKAELEWDEQQRRHSREKNDLEQHISLLKRKLEDKICVSDDEKVKQQVVNKTYSEEIRLLKEELRNATCEKLAFVKRVQELEGQLNLHNRFQETLVGQMTEIRKRIKSISEECQELTNTQTKTLDNEKCIFFPRSEFTVLKNSSLPTQLKTQKNDELKKLEERNLELENLLLLSRKENEKTLNNFLESNKLLCEYMDKYTDAQEVEKSLNIEIEQYKNKMKTRDLREEELKNLIKYQENFNSIKEQTLTNYKSKTQTSCDCLEETYSENNSITGSSQANEDENSVTQNIIDTIISKDSISLNKSNAIEETSNTFSVFTDDETTTFRTAMKRKLNLMDEDEVVTTASKKPFIGVENGHWAFENQVLRTIEPLGNDDKSIPSSFNSVDDGEQQSQEKHVSKELSKSENAMSVIENDKCNRDGEIEMNDLVNVQMNLKDLKVCDAHLEN
ncbi:uncharacterized protein TNIN_87911 [Trichonephila inaurata madagascariensis]|uniref:Coiled-coil domain-containing protein 73 n=1 Tax=Trichonephila inaurata madagascariensis TaxID=2747483 RepID=A0A8X7CGW6_9ARAC|nr:uncharacterized protein TNIN_87911 [Trichonephila inaurata madagascariensis]